MRIRRKTDQLTMIVLFIICAWSFTTMYFLWRRTKKRDASKRSEFRDWFIYPQWNKLTNSAIRPERINLFVNVTKIEHRDSNNVLKHRRKVIMKSPRKNMIDFGREDLEVEGVDDYIFWYENFINNGHQLPILPRQQKCKKPLQDIAFLKTHYTGSDVITNILNRFGDLNNLNVALPTDGLSTFFWPMRFQWKYIDITLLNGSLPNIIANHARYNNDVMDNILNPNSVYITIIRDPVSQLETTFNNLEFGELLEIEAKEDQLKMFLKDPKSYIQGIIQRHRFKDSLNLIKNGQFFDLGLSTTDYHKKNVIKSTIQELYEKFTLVLVYEYLDESLVMLKRKLCWQIDDIVYLRFQHKNHNSKNRKVVSEELSEMIKSWNKADASLYEFFNRTLWEEIRYEGEDFWKELKEFKETLEKIELDCVGNAVNSDQFTLEEIPAEKQSSSYSYEASNGDTLSISEKRNIFNKKHREINRKKIRLKDLLAMPYQTNSHQHTLDKNPTGEEQGFPFPHKNLNFNDANTSTEENNNIHRNRHMAGVKNNNNIYNERFYKHVNTSNIIVGNISQKDHEIPLKEKTNLLNDYQFNTEGSGQEPRLQVNLNNMLNKQASRWNNYFCKKLLMSEIEYLDYFRKKHANAKVQVAKRGAFGIVKKCRNKKSGMLVAAKFIRRTTKSKAEFSREVKIMNQLSHGKIIKFIESFETDKNLIIVMELVDGKELFEKVMEDDFQLSEKKVAECIQQILIAVKHMHEKNIVHLDLKPENILCHDNCMKNEEVKIIDFGSSRELQNGIQEAVMCGTPEYVAPEVISYDPISLKTDIWSIGVITYVLLSGNSPFLGGNDNETMANVTHGEIDFEDDYESFENVTENAKQFIRDCLKTDPRKRISVNEALCHKWLTTETDNKPIANLENLKVYIAKRKWKGVINAVKAVGRFSARSNFANRD